MVYTVVAVSQLVLVLALETLHAAAAVQLVTEHLVCLDETLELSSEVSILALKALGVLFESFSFSEEISVVSAVLLRCDSKALDFATDCEVGVFFFFQAQLRVTDLHSNIGIASLLEVDLFSKIEVLSSDSFVISSKGSVLG